MPELPEVHTTASILQSLLPGLEITGVWSDYGGRKYHKGKKNIKDSNFFAYFKKETVGKKIKNVSRRGKNVLINLSGNKTIIVHMKMTGHLLYGKYKKIQPKRESAKLTSVWIPLSPPALKDPYNRFIHFVIVLSNKKQLALSDTRKFAKVTLAVTSEIEKHPDLSKLGPEIIHAPFSFTEFEKRMARKTNGKIKTVLMDQEIIAGVGNIYSDEILWATGIHPEARVKDIPIRKLRKIFLTMKVILKKGIDFGGDSMSDYRNPHGLPGKFHHHHRAYRNTGKKCSRAGCGGTIIRKIVGGRSAHFCDSHQKIDSFTRG